MECKLCGSNRTQIIYNGLIRDGGLGKYTKENVPMYQCQECNVIWHENQFSDLQQYYESKEYRNSLEGSSEAEKFYELHDRETLDKFRYTGTDIFRNKIVADIGCGCGAFLDFIKGVSKKNVAVEPSETYRKIMDEKGFDTYAYVTEAQRDYASKVDVVTTFDVIEHVENPREFIRDIFTLLSDEGQAIIGTPTDTPVMRALLGEIYEKKILFSTQHLWILAEKNLRMLAEEAGFSNIKVKYFQRYGIENLLGWLRDKEPNSEINSGIISETLNSVWKSQCAENGLADYIVMYLKK